MRTNTRQIGRDETRGKRVPRPEGSTGRREGGEGRRNFLGGALRARRTIVTAICDSRCRLHDALRRPTRTPNPFEPECGTGNREQATGNEGRRHRAAPASLRGRRQARLSDRNCRLARLGNLGSCSRLPVTHSPPGSRSNFRYFLRGRLTARAASGRAASGRTAEESSAAGRTRAAYRCLRTSRPGARTCSFRCAP
jgi:hypothetical protein